MKKLKLKKSVVSNLGSFEKTDMVKGGRPLTLYYTCEPCIFTHQVDSICICVTK